MSPIEIIIIVICVLAVLIAIWRIFFSSKISKKIKAKKESKKSDKKEDKNADKPKVEQAIKKEGADKKQEKPAEEKKEEKQEKKDTSFKIIRKQSEVKINKTALKSGSRNPSISKVFDKNGKRIDDLSEEQTAEVETEKIKEENKVQQKLEPFGAREYQYNEINTAEEFKINAPKGSPMRAPIIGDRTNFASHLNVSEDGNLSGIVGIGVHTATIKAESQLREIEQKNQDMIDRVQKDMLNRDFGNQLRRYESFDNEKPKQTEDSLLDKIDPETLILADIINNPKHKTNKRNDKF